MTLAVHHRLYSTIVTLNILATHVENAFEGVGNDVAHNILRAAIFLECLPGRALSLTP